MKRRRYRQHDRALGPPVLTSLRGTLVADPEQIKNALVRQAAAPVRWVDTMRAMASQGVTQVYECGPGRVLSGLAKRCADTLVGGALADLAGIEAALAA